VLTSELRERAGRIWDRILSHPFVVELYDGVLPMEKFRYYLIQDYNYLINFAKALALAGAKAPRPELMRIALELAYGTITGEMANYESLLREAGLSLEEAAEAEPNRVNISYMSYLLSVCSLEGFYQCMTAVLPCFWSYLEIAERHRDKLANNNSTVYKKWASTYLSAEYRRLVEMLRRVLDNSGLNSADLWPYFKEASLYELEFWNAAYAGH